MKYLSLSIMAAVFAFALPLKAQVTANDSTAVQLNEVVVEAPQQTISASVSTRSGTNP